MSKISPGEVDDSQFQSLRQCLAPRYAIKPSGLMEEISGLRAAEAYDEYLEGPLTADPAALIQTISSARGRR